MAAPESSSAAAPPARGRYRLLAWPRYERRDELEFLLREFAVVAQQERREIRLCLRVDPALDPPPHKLARALRRARRQVFGWRGKLDYEWIDGALSAEQVVELGASVTWAAELWSSNEAERTAFFLSLGAPLLRSGRELREALARRRERDQVLDVYGEERSARVQIHGRDVELHYPHTPGILPYLQNVLNGTEYPLFLPGRYQAHTVLDVGGHVGCAALHFAAAYPAASVYSFEPAARSYAFLERNAAGFANVRVFPYGLWNADGTATLRHGATSSMENSIAAGPTVAADGETVELRRASAELRRLGVEEISILKIDTEGCELPILRDLAEWLPRTDFLYLEYHSERDRVALEELLRPHFGLCAASASVLHRGSNVYLAHRLVERFPELGEAEIRLER